MSPVPDATTRQRSRRGDGEQLREEILDAAEGLLVEKGDVDAVSVRAIAKRVGVTPPSLYLHFADKDELFFHVCCRRYDEFDDTLRRAAEGHETVAEEMLSMGRAYVAYGLERPEAYQVLFGVKADVIPDDVPQEELPGMQAFFRLVGAIERGVEAGEFRKADPIGTAIAIWAQMHGLVLLLMQEKGDHVPIPEDIVEQVGAHALQGLLAR